MASAPTGCRFTMRLSPGTRLDEFEIVRVLGTGGFGIVYLARDQCCCATSRSRSTCPRRWPGEARASRCRCARRASPQTFAKGLESFLSEARLLASFDHRSLVKVHRFWRGNGTAYMAMQYYPGQTLKDARLRMSAAPDEAWLDAFIEALLGVLELLHGAGRVPPRHLARQHPAARRRPAGAARLRLGAPRHGRQPAVVHGASEAAVRADRAVRRRGRRHAPGAVDRPVRARRDAVLRRSRAARRRRRWCAPFATCCRRSPSQAGATIPRVARRLLATIDWTLALAPEQRPQSVLVGAARAERRDRAAAAVAATARRTRRSRAGSAVARRSRADARLTRSAAAALVLAPGGHLLGAAQRARRRARSPSRRAHSPQRRALARVGRHGGVRLGSLDVRPYRRRASACQATVRPREAATAKPRRQRRRRQRHRRHVAGIDAADRRSCTRVALLRSPVGAEPAAAAEPLTGSPA